MNRESYTKYAIIVGVVLIIIEIGYAMTIPVDPNPYNGTQYAYMGTQTQLIALYVLMTIAGFFVGSAIVVDLGGFLLGEAEIPRGLISRSQQSTRDVRQIPQDVERE